MNAISYALPVTAWNAVRINLYAASAFDFCNRRFHDAGLRPVSKNNATVAKESHQSIGESLQRWMEHDAYSGVRPSTSSRSHWSISGQSMAQVPKSAMWR